jgi:hypothetical protein
MSLLFGLLAALAAIAGLALALAKLKTRPAAQTLRIVLGVSGLILGAVLTLRGLAVAGVPLVGAALGLLGVALRGGANSQQTGEQSAEAPRPANRAMSRREAAELLGVAQTASAEEINRAYRELMKKVHPDAGGNDALASKVQEAREILTGKR